MVETVAMLPGGKVSTGRLRCQIPEQTIDSAQRACVKPSFGGEIHK